MSTARTLLTALAACSLATVSAAQALQTEDTLALAPADAFLVAHLDDADGLRSQLARNQYYRFLTSPQGLPGALGSRWPAELQAVLSLDPTEEELASLGEEERKILELLQTIRGSATFYLAQASMDHEPVVGIALQPGERMEDFVRLVSGFAEDSGEVTLLERNGLQVGVPTRSLTDSSKFEAGMIFSADTFALVAGDSPERTREEFERMVERMSGGEGESVAQSPMFPEAMAALRAPGQIDVFLDLTPFLAFADRLPQADDGPAPEEVMAEIGLDQMRWVAGRLGVGAGENLDFEMQVYVPEDTRVAAFLDLFGPMPLELMDRLPADLVSVSAGSFDLAGLYDMALDTVNDFAEGMGDMARAQVEQFGGMLGVDLEEDVLRQFTGAFASFSVPAAEFDAESDPMRAAMLSSGLATAWVAELYDGDVLADSLDDLLEFGGGMMGMPIELETVQVGGFDLTRPAGVPILYGFSGDGPRDVMAFGLEADMVAALLADPAGNASNVFDHPQLGPLVSECRSASSFAAGLTAQSMLSMRNGFLNLMGPIQEESADAELEEVESVLERVDQQMIQSFFEGVGISTFERLPNAVRLHYRTR